MIAALRGTLVEKSLEEAVIDVGGVGYRVAFSTLTLGKLPPEGEPVQVRVRTVVREDAFELFARTRCVEEIHVGRLARHPGDAEAPVSAARVRRLREVAG